MQMSFSAEHSSGQKNEEPRLLQVSVEKHQLLSRILLALSQLGRTLKLPLGTFLGAHFLDRPPPPKTLRALGTRPVGLRLSLPNGSGSAAGLDEIPLLPHIGALDEGRSVRVKDLASGVLRHAYFWAMCELWLYFDESQIPVCRFEEGLAPPLPSLPDTQSAPAFTQSSP